MTSIRARFTVVAMALLVLFVGLMLASNSLLLEPYYVLRTRASFLSAYRQALSDGASSPELLAETLRSLGADTGYKLMVTDREGWLLASSVPEYQQGARLSLPKDQGEYFLEHRREFDEGRISYGALDKGARGQSVVQLVGRLDERSYIVITQPLEQLRASARVANSFSLIIGALMMAVGSFAVLLLSRRVTRPILEITGIASAIAHLDFSRRYRGRGRDELGLLGESINTISERLSGTISELRSANDQLRIEMQLHKRFLASVSHEFKTPVGLIRGYAESLALGMLDSPKDREDVAGIIVRESDRLAALVNDIMYVMRMDSRALPLEIAELDVGALLREAAERFAAEAGKRRAALQVDSREGLRVRADEKRIKQVLGNLLSNAVRHVSEDGVIRLTGTEDGTTIRLEVFNSGPQIPEAHLGRLFEPFYRVEEDRSRDRGGSGLGLSIVRAIVSAHGGSCAVHNSEGGVLFRVVLPREGPCGLGTGPSALDLVP